MSGAGARRLVLTHGERERYLQLAPGAEALIGRAIDAAFFLNDASISRRHCLLRATPTGIEVEDLASRNACFVNGRRVLTRTPLPDGGVLQVGKLVFSVRFLEQPPSVACSLCGATVAPDRARERGHGPLCEACFGVMDEGGEWARLREAIEAHGFVVRQAIAGIPPSFLVERPGVGKVFVVKAIEVAEGDLARLARIREETRLLARFDHEAIAAIHDVIEDEDLILLVGPHETVPTLADRVREKGPLAPADALEVARACARAVQYAARFGVVHRDITPAHVLVGERPGELGQVRLGSFSLASELVSLSRTFTSDTARDTERLLYLAPELLTSAAEADVRADVFGIGAILVFSLTGRSPWGSGTAARDIVRNLVGGSPLQPVLDGVPKALVPPLGALLAVDQTRRPATPDEALSLLADAARALGSPGGRVIAGGFAGEELIEFVQLIEVNRKSGELEVWAESLSGKLTVSEGRLASATTSSMAEGVAAARALLSAPTGRFRFTPGEPAKTGGPGSSLGALLLDVARERDERERRRSGK